MVVEERDLGVVLRDDLKVSSNCQQADSEQNVEVNGETVPL